jgi:hypothetical protein
MKRTTAIFLSVLATFSVKVLFSQDENIFSSDEHKYFIGFQMGGAFPVGTFKSTDISFPCNSNVNTGSAFELTLGYKINNKIGGEALLSEGLFELDPSGLGASQLLSNNPGLYQTATVFKSGQLSAQSALIGAFYTIYRNNIKHISVKAQALAGIIGCTIPEVEISAPHNPTAADKNGNSIDTTEGWDAPKIYTYSFSFRVGASINYVLNKHIAVFASLDFQGSPLTFSNIQISYSETITSTNTNTNSSATLSSGNYTKEVCPTLFYQSVILGVGCEVTF